MKSDLDKYSKLIDIVFNQKRVLTEKELKELSYFCCKRVPKKLAALKIIVENNVDMWTLMKKINDSYTYNQIICGYGMMISKRPLKETEFEIIKEGIK